MNVGQGSKTARIQFKIQFKRSLRSSNKTTEVGKWLYGPYGHTLKGPKRFFPTVPCVHLLAWKKALFYGHMSPWKTS